MRPCILAACCCCAASCAMMSAARLMSDVCTLHLHLNFPLPPLDVDCWAEDGGRGGGGRAVS